MGCKGPGADVEVPKYGSALSIAWFSVALYYKAGMEKRDLRVLWLSGRKKQKLWRVSDPGVVQVGV